MTLQISSLIVYTTRERA